MSNPKRRLQVGFVLSAYATGAAIYLVFASPLMASLVVLLLGVTLCLSGFAIYGQEKLVGVYRKAYNEQRELMHEQRKLINEQRRWPNRSQGVRRK